MSAEGERVASRMQRAIEQSFDVPALRELALQCLDQKRTEAMLFGELVLLHHQMFSASPKIDADARGVPEQVAAAVELMMLAFDIFDDLQDRDQPSAPWMQVDPALAINVAIGLQQLSMLTLQSCDLHEPHRSVMQQVFYNWMLQAINGQHLDLIGGQQTEQECLYMLEKKSGSLVAGACLVGTVLATGQPDERVIRYGKQIGIAAQIRNDIRDVQRLDEKSDVLQKKWTLPMLYLIENEDPQLQIIRDYVAGLVDRADLLARQQELVSLIVASGCLEYASVWMRLCQHEAAQIIEQLAVDPIWKKQLLNFL